MTVIKIPKPPSNAYDPGRPMSSLLKMQIEHLSEAEKRLPSRYRSEIYVNAIRTEGEAANYIRLVTYAIHEAHADAERARHGPKRVRGLGMAAIGDQRTKRQRKGSVRKDGGKKDTGKKGKKK